MRHLHHLTLQTGDNRRSWRHEINPQVLRATSELLGRALDEGRVPLPVRPAGYVLQVTAHGRCMVATVWHDDELPLATFGVAGHSRCGASLWHSLADTPQQPQVPWCVVRLEAGLPLMADATEWLGDLERCIAWAWLDRIEVRA